MKKIIVIPLKQTSMSRHYVAYVENKGKEPTLIAPCYGQHEAKTMGMNYNNSNWSLPAYTFKIGIYTNSLLRNLQFTMETANKYHKRKVFAKGDYQVTELSGYAPQHKGIVTIQF